MSAAGDSTEKSSRILLWALAAAALAILVHLDALGHELVFDDLALIRGNERIRSLGLWREWFATSYWGPGNADGLWRPLTLASYAVNHALGGLEPAGYAVGNLALHGAVCAALVGWMRSLGARVSVAGAAGLVFAVLPVHVEAVVGFVGRAELLCALGVVGALWAERGAGGASGGRRVGLRALALVCGAAALLSKETAAVLPALVLVQAVLVPRGGEPGERRARELVALVLPWAVLVGAWLAARWSVLGALGPDAAVISPLDNPLVAVRALPSGREYGVELGGRVAGALAILVEELRLLVWPVRLSCDWSLDATAVPRGTPDLRSALGAVVLAGTLAAAWITRRRAPLVALGIACAWLALLPASNLVIVAGTILAERLLYLPSLFALVALAAAASSLARRGHAPALALAGLAALVVVLGAWRSARRARDWRDGLALWSSAVAAAPESAKARREWAKLLWREGLEREREGDAAGARTVRIEAVAQFERALALFPDEEESALHLADLWRKLGELDRAIAAQRLAVAIDPDDLDDATNLAVLLVLSAEGSVGAEAVERDREALEAFGSVLARDPDHRAALRARAALLAERMNRPQEAARDLRRAAEGLPPGPERERLEARARALDGR